MILLIGKNIQVSESLADLLSQKQQLQFINIERLPELETMEKLLPKVRLFIINLYGIYDIGLNLIQEIRSLNPKAPIVAMDNHESQSISDHLLNNGVNAYIPLPSNGEDLNTVIDRYLS